MRPQHAYAELRENTTWDLVEDIEKLRKHLEIERWVVFGGSWGARWRSRMPRRIPRRAAR